MNPPNSPNTAGQLRRAPLARTTPLQASQDSTRAFQQRARSNSSRKRRPVSPASAAQRAKCREAFCVVCGASPCDPAHLIPRGMLSEGQDDPRAVIPLDRGCHEAYDRGTLDLLPYEFRFREEMAYASYRFGALQTIARVSNTRWVPIGEAA